MLAGDVVWVQRGTGERLGLDIGVHGDMTQPRLAVRAVAEGGVAERAGLRAGDRILELNGVAVAELCFDRDGSGKAASLLGGAQ